MDIDVQKNNFDSSTIGENCKIPFDFYYQGSESSESNDDEINPMFRNRRISKDGSENKWMSISEPKIKNKNILTVYTGITQSDYSNQPKYSKASSNITDSLKIDKNKKVQDVKEK